jgi:hypothetical protein
MKRWLRPPGVVLRATCKKKIQKKFVVPSSAVNGTQNIVVCVISKIILETTLTKYSGTPSHGAFSELVDPPNTAKLDPRTRN